MTSGRGRLPSLSAALAGIPAGVQPLGPWSGRRQLFVRFAMEAETATIYSASALRGELSRLAGRSRYHSVAITGGDVLAEIDFLLAAFHQPGMLPVMLDHDGQRPDALDGLLPALAMVQVTMEGSEGPAAVERACASIVRAAEQHVAHAVAIVVADTLSDGPLLRIVEQIHDASVDAQIVVHPAHERGLEHEQRWVHWLEQAMAVHADIRVLPRPRVPARVAGS
jgi:organic radical activating enzyme